MCGAVLADRQGSEHPASSTVEPTAERGEQQPMDARGVTERTDADGRARASKTRRTPARRSAGRRPLWVAGVSKAATEGVTAIVPIRSVKDRRNEGRTRCDARGNPPRVERELGRDPCSATDGTGCRNDRRPFGGYCCARASAAAQRNDARPALGPRNKNAFLQPMGWNLATSSANPSRSLIK